MILVGDNYSLLPQNDKPSWKIFNSSNFNPLPQPFMIQKVMILLTREQEAASFNEIVKWPSPAAYYFCRG